MRGILFRGLITGWLVGCAAVPHVMCAEEPAPAGFRPTVESVRLSARTLHTHADLDVWITLVNTGDRPAEEDRVLILALAPAGATATPTFGHDWPMRPTVFWQPGLRFVEHVRFPGTHGYGPGRYTVLLGLREDPAATRSLRPGTALEHGLCPLGTVEYRPHPVLPSQPIVYSYASLPARAPVEPTPEWLLLLESRQLAVSLFSDMPAVREIVHRPSGVRYAGPPPARQPRLRLACGDEGRMAWTGSGPTIRWSGEVQGATASYTGHASWDGVPCATVEVRIGLLGDTLTYELHRVEEGGGYHVLELSLAGWVELPCATGAWLAHPVDGGKHIDLATAEVARHSLALGMLCPLSLAMLGREGSVCLVRTESLEDELVAAVHDTGGRRQAAIGITLVHRAQSGESERRIRVQPRTRADLVFLSSDKGAECAWMEGATWLQARYPPRAPLPRGIVYKILLDAGPDDPGRPFSAALEMIRRVAAFTDGLPQLVFLVGWQSEGHDTGYPAIDTVNPALGGRDGLLHLMREARKYNAEVSFHDNYDDHFISSPAFDPSLQLIDQDGHAVPGGAHNGGPSRAVAFPLYLRGAAQQRVAQTLDLYPIQNWYHLDVLSTRVRERHHDPAAPAARAEVLAAKLALIRAFSERGVEVSSESVMQPFLGAIGHFYHLVHRPKRYFGNDRPIPLVPAVCHQCCVYGSNTAVVQGGIAGAVWAGSLVSRDFRPEMRDDELCDLMYLVNLPALVLTGRPIRSYRHEAGTDVIGYGEGSEVAVDLDAQRYRVRVDGREMAGDYWTVYRKDERTFLALTARGEPLRIPLPIGKAGNVRVDLLTPDGPLPVTDWRREGGEVVIPQPVGHQPYRIQVRQ